MADEDEDCDSSAPALENAAEKFVCSVFALLTLLNWVVLISFAFVWICQRTTRLQNMYTHAAIFLQYIDKHVSLFIEHCVSPLWNPQFLPSSKI